MSINIVKKRIPEKLRTRIGQQISGPNCWNTAIAFHDDKEPLRFTNDYEIDRWLKEYTITVDKVKFGDILVMRGPNPWITSVHRSEANAGEYMIHTAVYIGLGYYLHKRGYHGKWEILDFDGVLNIYGHASKIYHVRLMSYIKGE